MVEAEMIRCGFESTASAEDGDIAVIDMPVGPSETAAARASVVIRYGPWWIGKTLDGIAGISVTPKRCWKVS